MRYLSTAEIEEKAIGLLGSMSALVNPVPVDVIAHRLGLRVDYAPLGNEVAGILVIDEGVATIGVNHAHPEVRQRFTIAHEIAHFVLHREYCSLFIDKEYTAIFRDIRAASGKDRLEIQANQFAAALLMPIALLEAEIREQHLDLGDEEALQSLVDAFTVSAQAMVYRLTNTKLLEKNLRT